MAPGMREEVPVPAVATEVRAPAEPTENNSMPVEAL